MDLTKGKVLVTGAGGFIGSHLVEALVAKGCDVRALVHYRGDGKAGWLDHSPAARRVEIVAGDVCFGVDRIVRGCRTIFHLAARVSIPDSYADPEAHFAINAGGTRNLLRAARGVDQFVHTSTSEVYGTAQRIPMDESHPINPQSPYAAAKASADHAAMAQHLSFGLPVAVVRPFNTYGPRQSARAIIPAIILQMLNGNRIELGDERPRRDFTHVSDTVAGFIAVAEHDDCLGKVTNLGGGEVASVGDLVHLATEILRWEGEVVFRSREQMRPETSEVWHLCSDATRASTLAHWRGVETLRRGIETTAQWLCRNSALYRAGHQL